MPVKTTEEASNLVKVWMEDRGFLTKETSYDSVHFQYEGHTENGISFSIAQPKRFKRIVLVISKLEFHPKHLESLKALDQTERDNFLWEIREKLVLSPPTFSFDQSDIPTWIQFAKEISFDELTEGRLMDSLDNIVRGVILVSWMFGRKFGQPEE
jgi:hypothetical protein